MSSNNNSVTENYNGIDITKANIDAQPPEDIDQEFRLVKLAIDNEMFKEKPESITIGREAHTTTGNNADKFHLTLSITPGHATARLYLTPEDAKVLTDDTDVSRLTMPEAQSTATEASVTEADRDFWTSPSCAEHTIDHSAHTTANTDATKGKIHAAYAVFVRSDRLWANGTTITYSFLKQEDNASAINQRTKVSTVIKEWEKYANIEFSPPPGGTTAMIRIAFDRSSGSWSYVGKENLSPNIGKDKATMNLGWVFGDSPEPSDDDRGVILHEFGHALGLMHEHQSPRRGEQITLDEDAVIQFYTASQGWQKNDVIEQIIRVYNTSQISNFSELDTTSIMMYFMPAAMNLQRKKVPPNNKLSAMDQAFMTINYPSADRSQFNNALDVAGVQASDKVDMLRYYDAQDWSEVRFSFTSFCTQARVAQNLGQKSDGDDHPSPDDNVPGHAPLPPLIDGCLAEETVSAPPTGAHSGVAAATANLWPPGGKITYSFIQGTAEATPYRKLRVKQTFDYYATRANLSFEEIEYHPIRPKAQIRIYFGPVPQDRATGWSKIGKASLDANNDIEKLGGTVDTSMNFSDIVPKEAPTEAEAKVREMRTLYHEIGHSLGLKHEHTSPYTKTCDDPVWNNTGAATPFDERSVMLYANKELRAGSLWETLANYFNPKHTKYNHEPSMPDLAFLGAIYPRSPDHINDRFELDLLDLGIAETQPYVDLRHTAFTYFATKDFPQHIKVIRDKLRRDLMAVARARAPHPEHGVNSPKRQRAVNNPATKPTTGSFLDELMKQLSAFFRPTSGQLLALQFPGRFLQQSLYAWDTNKAGIYGQFVKPISVNESEFRLVDQLYNVGTVIGAPSGLNLSIVYEQVLNNLVPGILQSQINFSKQQGEIRGWLMKDVPTSGWVKDLISAQQTQTTGGSANAPGGASRSINPTSSSLPSDITHRPQFSLHNKLNDNKVNRMELAAALMQEYLNAKQAWELDRDKMIREASGKDLDDVTRRLAHITAIREQQLASKHADAVVRGYSHTIRQYLGYMDIKSPAEALQDAKDALRESAVSSLSGSMKVYPVQMQPIDWFQSLSTSFTMEDLTADPDLILQQINSKSKQLDALNSRLAVLQGRPKANVKELQSKLDAAQEAYDRANADLTTSYSTNIISLARASVNAKNQFVMADFVASAKSAKIATGAFDNIEQGMKRLTDASLNVQKSSRALTQLLAAKSLAEATDTTQEITETTVLITALTKEISELTARLQSLRYRDGAETAVPNPDPSTPSTIKLEEVPLLKPNTSSGGSRWQDFSFCHEVKSKYSSSSNKSSASTRNTSVSLFFGSYQSSSSSSSSTSNEDESSSSLKVEVGFRATLVTVDRGGWFQPQFFKQSAGFHSIDTNVSWSKWPDSVKTVQDLSGIGAMNPADAEAACNEINKHLLPAYPTGFVICKDITIKIQLEESNIHKSASEMETFAATSAGILCFSTSSSDSSKSSEKEYGFQAVADGCVIRIPGPQILGYILQFTDPDTTTGIPETLPKDFLISDDIYNSVVAPRT